MFAPDVFCLSKNAEDHSTLWFRFSSIRYRLKIITRYLRNVFSTEFTVSSPWVFFVALSCKDPVEVKDKVALHPSTNTIRFLQCQLGCSLRMGEPYCAMFICVRDRSLTAENCTDERLQ